MTTLESQSDNSLCHLDKLPHVEWDNSTPGSSGCTFSDGLSPLECQMAGHPFDGKKHTIGMLRKQNGHILKPATKAILGEREIAFYENLQYSLDPTVIKLRYFVPPYYGTTELKVFNKRTKFLTLKDITEGMAEPCVMDIKIGRRTWDPLATPEKRATEELKYAESKRAYGFCITGFQVYCLSTGQLKKFDRDYGKKLDAKGVVEALETFLNITPERPACQQLILKLLSFLWRVRVFFRSQRKFRFYSSSLLVAYDARRLRQHSCSNDEDSDTSTSHQIKFASSTPSSPTISGADTSEEKAAPVSIVHSGKRILTEVPITLMLKKSVSLSNSGLVEMIDEKTSNQNESCNPDRKVDHQRPCYSYSTQFHVKNSSEDNCDWVRANMIDFTHVFPSDENCSIDLNYLEGVENLFKLLEKYLVQDYKSELGHENTHAATTL